MKYHTAFRLKTGEYSDRMKKENKDLPKLTLEITDFAKDWLMKHILVADKAYAPFFQANGLN
jgi:hemerythrin